MPTLKADKIEQCRRLYIKHGGSRLREIQREMRELGYERFSHRILHARGTRPGWIEQYGWRKRRRRKRAAIKPPAETVQTGPEPLQFPTFPDWLKTLPGDMDWDLRHLRFLYDRLKDVTEGNSKRLMICMPPRHGKSETVTVRYTAWRLLQQPSLNIILGSYNQKLANRFSLKVRRVLCDSFAATGVPATVGPARAARTVSADKQDRQDSKRRETTELAPDPAAAMFPFTASKPANSLAEWGTAVGGGLRAVGVGAGIAGYGAGLIVLDDPIRNRADAESPTLREKVWSWFNDDLYTRLEADGAIILILTRWHEDDLAGRLIKQMDDGGERWEIVSLPAIATEDVPQKVETGIQQLARTQGDALCPERFDLPALERIRTQLGSYSFSALYQQEPMPPDGATFKRDWFRTIVDTAPPGLRWCRGYDLALSTKTSADYTASFRCAKDKMGYVYIADGFRSRIEFPEQRRYVIERITGEPGTAHGIEAAIHGQALVQELRRDATLSGRAFKAVRVDADKLTRALGWANIAEEGKIILVRGPWIDAFLEEVIRFPTGAHDDQVDAVSIAIKMLSETGSRGWGI